MEEDLLNLPIEDFSEEENKNSSKIGATTIMENSAIADVGPLVNESFRNLTATCSLFVGFVIRETAISTRYVIEVTTGIAITQKTIPIFVSSLKGSDPGKR